MPAIATDVRDLTQELKELLNEKLAIEVPSSDTDLLQTGLIDSLQLVQLLLHVEEHIGDRIPLEELSLEDLRSLESLAGAIAARRVATP